MHSRTTKNQQKARSGAKHRALEERFTIVKGAKKSAVNQKELDKMNAKYGGWWPKTLAVKK